ncbi:MAG: ImmA/IrrE family metallo-endopeptidase [Dehalococcoidia bacterium]
MLGLPPHAPLSAIELAARLDVAVRGLADVPGVGMRELLQLLERDPGSWSAYTFQVQGRLFVIHNTAHEVARQESNLMHELAHLICEHTPRPFVKLDGVNFPLRTYDEEQEGEASWLGATLQLPRRGLEWAHRQGMSHDEIAEHFGASLPQVRYRARMTGIERQYRRTG